MSNEEKKPLFSILGVEKNEEGHLVFDFDLSDQFVDMFKKEHGLKRWSQKKFDEWVSENIDVILEVSGINQQIRDLDEPEEQT
jgi:hypothetical protein